MMTQARPPSPLSLAHTPAAALAILSLCLAATPAAAAPTEPFELNNQLETTDTCATCHLFFNPPEHEGEPNISPQAYTGSLMSNAARDPVFWAGVAIASQDAPGETESCIRCHSPVAFLEGRGDATSVTDLQARDLHGITCDACHRMIDDGETPAGNARYVIDDVAVDGTVPRRGPWTYGMAQDPQHPTSDDNAHIASARLCGTCHDVTTARDRVDAQGQVIATGFNEQRTYSEWLGSAFAENGPDARSCQDCHMPAIAEVAGCDGFNLAKQTHATGGRLHDLVGLNLPVMNLVQALYGKDQGGTIDDPYFDLSRARAEALRDQAASLAVLFPPAVDLSAGIAGLEVTVTNESGHKLPTGYAEGRVMWIELTARYGDALIYSSGLWDEDTREIEADPQVRRYEAIAEDFGDGTRLHLLRNNHWVLDSRVPPRGLTMNPETDPIGDRYTPVGGVWPHQDALSYSFPPAPEILDMGPELAPELALRVRLLYLINTPEYVAFLADENNTNAAGTELAALFAEHGQPSPIVLAEQTATVPLMGLEAGESSTGAATSAGPTSTGELTSEGPPVTSAGPSGDAGSDDAGSSEGPSESGADGEGCGCTQASAGRDRARELASALLALLLLGTARSRRETAAR
jgi:hypothetical protein